MPEMKKVCVLARCSSTSHSPRLGPPPLAGATSPNAIQLLATNARALAAPSAALLGWQPQPGARCLVHGMRRPSGMSTKLPWNEHSAFSQPGGAKAACLTSPPLCVTTA